MRSKAASRLVTSILFAEMRKDAMRLSKDAEEEEQKTQAGIAIECRQLSSVKA